ncbi:MAG: DUF5667 domain-containing protein, partial [Chloroflexi bacterium]|nr:DUF5667 domain-containing protein [Chloroflexota bacterium]
MADTMNEQGVDVALADCLARIGAGELTIDGCLTLYPNVEGLAEQLHVALTVKAVPPPTPDEAWFSASRKRLEDAVRPKPHSANLLFAIAPVGVLAWAWNRSGFWAPPAWTRSAALRAVTAMTVMTAASSGAAVAAGESLPGSALYSVKLATEDARLAASFDPTQRALLHLEFARNRFGEMRTIKSETTQPPPAELAAAAQTQIQAAARELGPAAVPEYSPKTAPLLAALTGREIEFRGAVQRLDAEMIQVSGAQVRVSRETAVTGAPAADAQVVVQAKLGLDGAYHALSIRVLPPQAPPEQRVSAPMPSAGPAQVNAAPAVAPAAAPRPAASAAQQGAALTAPTIA